jgi:23S rRNA pseudouridine1911/1915/1917 synthase
MIVSPPLRAIYEIAMSQPRDAALIVPDTMTPDAEDDEIETRGGRLDLTLTAESAGGRLDKTLAAHWPELSRGRIQALMAEGHLTRDGATITDPSSRAKPGRYQLQIPAVAAAEPQAEPIALVVLFEDAHLIVIDKPAGIAMHPAPGNETGTVVNALLHHCEGSLSGIGGVARPGIVHRIDKDTSGVVVVAKTDAAHQGLSALFAAHDIERVYVALTRGGLLPPSGTIEGAIARSTHDRKKMALVRSGGRHAITHYRVERVFGPTGRTHQIRVHLASRGAPCLGDAVYGSGAPPQAVRAAIAEAGLTRQALHAAVLGFRHPITGEGLRFESPLPPDMASLERALHDLAA